MFASLSRPRATCFGRASFLWRVSAYACLLSALLLAAQPALAQSGANTGVRVGRIANRVKSPNQRKLAAQRKYVTTYQLPPTTLIPVAPEGMPQMELASAAALEMAGVSDSVAPTVAPAPVLIQPAPAVPAPVIAQPAPVPPPAPAPVPQPAPAPVQPASVSPPATLYAPPPLTPYVPPPATLYVPPPMFTTPAPVFPSPQAPPSTLEASKAATADCNAAPAAMPALPPGYMLVPVSTSLTLEPAIEHQLLASELAIVNSQLGELRRDRKSLGGPIVRMVLGYGGMVVSSAVALGAYAIAETDGDTVTRHDQTTLRRTAYAFTGLAAAGLVLGLSGTIRLVRNAANNRALNAQVKPLMAKRANLLRQLEYGAMPGQRGLQVAVQGRF